MDKNNAFIYPTGFCEPIKIAAISVFLNTLTVLTAHTSSTTWIPLSRLELQVLSNGNPPLPAELTAARLLNPKIKKKIFLIFFAWSLVACSRLSDSGEDAKVKGTQKVGGVKKKTEGRESL